MAAIEEEKEEEEANQGGGDTKGIICTNSLFNSRRKQEGSPLAKNRLEIDLRGSSSSQSTPATLLFASRRCLLELAKKNK